MSTGEHLAWGIKSSFLGYLESLPDCTIGTGGGAWRDAGTGRFHFPLAQRVELDDDGVRLEYSGEVRIQAHGGMLLVILMNPWLSIGAGRTEFSTVDLMFWPDTSHREVLGVSGITSGTEFPLTLAESAVETFNNVYPAGEPLDPVFLNS